MQGISFFSVLSWSFFLTSVVGALILTTLHAPLVRKYRSTIISVTLSCIFLGLVSGTTPFLLKKLNPDESRLVPIEQLVSTLWSEPLENPLNELSAEETAWTENYPARFRYKLHLPFSFKRWITAYEHYLVMMDEAGAIRGFDAYSGLNHWSIPMQISDLLAVDHEQKRLFLLDHFSRHDLIRMTCIDLQTPSVVWQRTIPGTGTGGMIFDFNSQTLLVTSGGSGVWALQGKTGEILWKRPEIYSTATAIHAGKFWIVFEPEIAKRPGHWFWLDEQTGKIISKVAHSLASVSDVTPVQDAVLAVTTDAKNKNQPQLERLQKPELNSLWSFPLTDPLAQIMVLNNSQFLLIYQNHLAELRAMNDHAVLWQKKLTGVESRFTTLTTDHKLFVMPSESNDLSFFELATGEWKFSAKASEAIQATAFFGDWLYWISENQLWGYQKK